MSDNNSIDNKNYYYKCRKELGYTRNEACDLLQTISIDRLERIENDRLVPTPADICEMIEAYKMPELCNYFCTHNCELGDKFVTEIKTKELSQIVLETLASLNSISNKRDRLIEIAVDGKITGDELRDFVSIKFELEKVSMTIESLKLWTEQMKSSGIIDEAEYEDILNELISHNK